MGINKLNSFIKKSSPRAITENDLSDFKNKKIAIDCNNYAYILKSTAQKRIIPITNFEEVDEPDEPSIRRELLLLFINFIKKLLEYNITPVFVFDGIHPVEKMDTKTKRHEVKNKLSNNITENLNKLRQCDNILQKGLIIEQIRKDCSNNISVSDADIESLKLLFESLGIPCLVSIEEAEKLCSALCIENRVAGVLSKDTDNLAYGCPLLISEFRSSYGTATLTCIRLDYVLEDLKMSYESFLDFCIMCGCDYNSNIKNYGPKRSYDLIKKHHKIENLPKKVLDISECLNYEFCRKMFNYVPSGITSDSELNVSPSNLQHAQTFLDKYSLSAHINSFKNLYNSMSS